MNTIDVTAPAEQTEGTRSQLLRWLRSVGEPVVENEPLVEIETDKVTVEVAAPGSGVLAEVLKQPQDELAPGELLGRITVAGGAKGSAGAGAPGAGAGLAATGPAGGATASGRAGVSRESVPATATAVGAAATDSVRTGVSPAVQRLLDQHGLRAADLRGSGPAGQITVDDVLSAAGVDPQARVTRGGGDTSTSLRVLPPTLPAATPVGSAATNSAANPAAASARPGIRSVQHTPVRRRIAQHMVESLLRTAPHVTTVFEADLAAVLADREQRRRAFEQAGAPLTLTAYFVRAAVAAIRAVPQANSQWTDTALEIHENIHIGIGTAVEDVGLMVPVLRDAGALDLMGIARGLADLTQRARSGGLTPADVRGGTFTISNHGVSGSLLAAPIIINQPQAAILGIGKLERRAVVTGEGAQERIVVRPRCYVTLTLDHRVMDGHQANHFMRVFVGELDQPG